MDKQVLIIDDPLAKPPAVENVAEALTPTRVGVHVPEGCDEAKIVKALLKLEHAPMPISKGASALLPLSPMEKGFVLGILAAVRRDG